MRQLQIANENRRQIERPDQDDEHAKENYEAKIQHLMAMKDETEERETEYAHLSHEEQNLTAELESLNDRRKNMQLINDQVSGWLKRVSAKMQDQLHGMRINTEDRSVVEVLREIAGLAKQSLSQIKQK